MATIKLKFTNAGLLKNINKNLLLKFFRNFPEPFAAAGIDISDNQPEELDYARLSRFFVEADNLPEKFIAALCLVDGVLARERGDEWLVEQCAQLGIEIDENSTAADIALQVWFCNPTLLRKAATRHVITKIRTLRSFFPADEDIGRSIKDIEEKDVPVLEYALSRHFTGRKYGDYASVTFIEKDGVKWFLIQHGDRMKQEGRVDGKYSSIVIYRPELFDIVTFAPKTKELRIKCSQDKDRDAYRHIFGMLFANDVEYFSNASIYDLKPLQKSYDTAGVDILNARGIDGLSSVVLRELHMEDGDGVLIKKADDVLKCESTKNLNLESREFICAKFNVTTYTLGKKDSRMLQIKPPNTLVWTDENTLPIIEKWINEVGFIKRTIIENLDEANA